MAVAIIIIIVLVLAGGVTIAVTANRQRGTTGTLSRETKHRDSGSESPGAELSSSTLLSRRRVSRDNDPVPPR